MRKFWKLGASALALASVTTPSSAQETTYTLYGTPGLVEMPTARSAPDGEIIASYSHWNLQQKTSLTFQITPRLSGTFRYSGIDQRSGPGTDGTFDRSFDLRYRLLDESDMLPAVAIGIQDFLGTGLLSSEYVVATKAVTGSIDVTAGLGWGRFATRGGFDNPFGLLDQAFNTRPALDFGEGGEPSTDQFFRGDAAVFGGIDYRYSEKLSFQLEYSSDAYQRESDLDTIDVKSPLNFGMIYRPNANLAFNLAYLQGSEIAGAVTVSLNPTQRMAPSLDARAPRPLSPVGSNPSAASTWASPVSSESDISDEFAAAGLKLEAYRVAGDTARIRYSNARYRSEAQAMGRAVRILTNYLPDTVTKVVAEPSRQGIALSAVTFDRADLEAQEFRANGPADLLAASTASDAVSEEAMMTVPDTSSRFMWGIGPYVQLSIFNANDPVQIDGGLKFAADYRISPQTSVSGVVNWSARGKTSTVDTEPVAGDYPVVRRDSGFFGRDGVPAIQKLTLDHYGRVGTNLYARGSVGYLERQYGGVSTEVLWKPVDSRLALGAEVNYVAKRDRDMLLGFQDFDTVTGHVSGYYSFENGFHAQVDVGRYLAGDWGASFSLDREFENGWKVGAYFTLTEMPFEEFGEGSFDKGIRVEIPLDYFLGTPSRAESGFNLRSLSRDGGARLSVDGRLYDFVRDGHIAGNLGDTWGRFWQ